MTRMSQALQKIQQAGFHLSVDGPDLIVHPPGKLSPAQRRYIVDHKVEIMAALLEAAPAGNDHPPANDGHPAGPRVNIEQLPDRLVTAATRVCREIHRDDAKAVQTMLEYLCWNDPADWPALIQHFEGQLPPPPKAIPPTVTCSGCRHAEYRHHPAIAHCRAGVDPGNPTGGRWAIDPHPCEKWEGRTAKSTAEDARQGTN